MLTTFFISYLAWLIQTPTIYRFAMSLEALSGLMIVYFVQAIFTNRLTQVMLLIFAALLIMRNTVIAEIS